MRTFFILASLLLGPTAEATILAPGEVTFREAKNAKDLPLYVLEVKGALAHPMALQMRDFLAELKGKQTLLIIFNSPGGSQKQGLEMIRMIKEEKAKRLVETSVENGSTCASMCVPVFLQGKNRYAGEGSLFMFHGASQMMVSNVPNAVATEESLSVMLEAGLAEEWLNARRAEGVFTLPGAYWISGRELFDAKSNVITKLIPRHVKETPWTADFDPQIRSR